MNGTRQLNQDVEEPGDERAEARADRERGAVDRVHLRPRPGW